MCGANCHLTRCFRGQQGTKIAEVRFATRWGGNAMWLQLWTVTLALAVGLAGIAMTLPDDA
jgi:hypothetical protein